MREFTQEELSEMQKANVQPAEVSDRLDAFPDETVVVAIGSVVMLKNGEGQERNKGFETQAQADAEVSGSEQAKQEESQVASEELEKTSEVKAGE